MYEKVIFLAFQRYDLIVRTTNLQSILDWTASFSRLFKSRLSWKFSIVSLRYLLHRNPVLRGNPIQFEWLWTSIGSQRSQDSILQLAWYRSPTLHALCTKDQAYHISIVPLWTYIHPWHTSFVLATQHMVLCHLEDRPSRILGWIIIGEHCNCDSIYHF